MKIKIGNKIYGLKYVDSDEYGQSLMELIEEKEPLISDEPKEGDIVIAWDEGKEDFAIIGELKYVYLYLYPEASYLVGYSSTFDHAIKWDGTAKQYFDIKNKNK